jgi:hypothetical protein
MVVGKRGSTAMPAHLRQPVLPTAKSADISVIELKKGEQSLKFARGTDNIWYLGEASSGKAIAAGQVVHLLDDLTQARLDQAVGSDKDGVADYGLGTPTVVSLTAKDQQLIRVHLGSARSGGGQYVSIPDDPSIYLTARLVQVNLDEGSWLAPPPPPTAEAFKASPLATPVPHESASTGDNGSAPPAQEKK